MTQIKENVFLLFLVIFITTVFGKNILKKTEICKRDQISNKKYNKKYFFKNNKLIESLYLNRNVTYRKQNLEKYINKT